MTIPIIYEDNHLLVVEKPPNILSQGDSTQDTDMLTLLKQDLKTRYKKPGNVYLGLVHRLDRPVGGIMVFAKTSKAAARLAEQLRKQEFGRYYLAVVEGKPKKAGILVHYLLKNRRTNMVSAVSRKTAGAKKAVSDFYVIGTVDNLSLVLVKLHTGRPHQIRVQFSASGYPLCNDHKYGNTVKATNQPVALWSYKIIFKHPTLKKELSFTRFPTLREPWTKFSGLIKEHEWK